MKRLLALSATALLAACNPPAAPPAAPKAVNPGPPLTPNPMPPGYLGRWAVTADQCETAPWVFSDKSLTTAAEVNCNFTQVTPNETGWIAEGACASDKASGPATLVLNTTRNDKDRTLAVSGGPFPGPRVLVACPAQPTPEMPAGPVNPPPQVEGR